MAKSPQPPSEPGPQLPADERLDSWKEIAAYLKREVRTVQIWEKKEGLPVHRHMHSGRGTVYAYRHELDTWWNNRRPALETEAADQDREGRRKLFRWVAISMVALLGLAAVAVWRYAPDLCGLPEIEQLVAGFPSPPPAALVPYTPHFWVPVRPAGDAPQPRVGARAIYNEKSGRLVFFGGYHSEFFNDVWVLRHANNAGGKPSWEKLAPRGGLIARMNHSAVYDPTHNRMVIFGGRSGTEWFNDVWVLTNADGQGGTPRWIELPSDGEQPKPRSGHSAVYDPATNRMVVYGGLSSTPGIQYSDVWVLENANGLGGRPRWRFILSGESGPGSRSDHGAVYEPGSNRMIVYGGFTIPHWAAPASSEVWILAHANGSGGVPEWIRLPLSGDGPAIRARHAVLFDSARNQMIVAFGAGRNYWLNDVWILHHANGLGTPSRWQRLNPPPQWPSERCCLSLAFDARRESMIVIGGDTPRGAIADLWVLDSARNIADEFADSFDSPVLDPAWQVFSGLGKYSLTEHPGRLRFRVVPSSASPAWLQLARQFQGESWTLESSVSYFTGPHGGGRSMTLQILLGGLTHHTSHSSIEIRRARDDWTGCCPGQVLFVFRGPGVDSRRPRAVLPVTRSDSYVFRIHRSGGVLRVEVSEDGQTFREVIREDFGPSIDGLAQFVILSGNSFSNFDSFADYDYIRLTKSSSPSGTDTSRP